MYHFFENGCKKVSNHEAVIETHLFFQLPVSAVSSINLATSRLHTRAIPPGTVCPSFTFTGLPVK